jgi:hypothetical protein
MWWILILGRRSLWIGVLAHRKYGAAMNVYERAVLGVSQDVLEHL